MLVTFLFKKIIKICWVQISLIFYQLFKTMLIFEILNARVHQPIGTRSEWYCYRTAVIPLSDCTGIGVYDWIGLLAERLGIGVERR